MIKFFKNSFYLFLVMFLLSACQSVKDGLTGKKQNNTDEFLVEKKNPLVLPPEFNILPKPETQNKTSEKKKEINLESILTKDFSKKKITNTRKVSNGSVEKNILEKIKNN